MKNEDVGEGLVPSRCPKRKTARLKDFDYAVGEGLVPSRYPKRKTTRLKDFDYAQAKFLLDMM